MLLAFGALFVALGLLSGGVLLAAAAGLSAHEPSLFAALAYPFLTAAGVWMLASSREDRRWIGPIRWVGRLCVLVGMVAAVALVLKGLGLFERPAGVFWLVWMLICGSSLGAVCELASRRPAPDA